MALHLNLDADGRVYFALTCDRCRVPFDSYDDACYSVASLRMAAIFAGWDAGRRPEQPHHCPSCLRTRDGSLASPHGVPAPR